MRAFRALLSDQGAVQVDALSDHEVLDRLSHLIRQRKLVLSTGDAEAIPGDVAQGSGGEAPEAQAKKDDAPPESTASAPPASPSPSETQKVWIKFAVVDEATGQPIAGVTLKIKLPTGEVSSFTTNGAGLIYIGNLDPGACDIVGMSDNSAFEVVDVAASNH